MRCIHRGGAGGKAFNLYKYWSKPISVEESVQGQLRVIKDLTTGDNGKFKDYKGNDYPV